MSSTYDIYCDRCKCCLWIGQASSRRAVIYSDEKHNAALATFLYEHQRHELRFMEDQQGPWDYVDLSDYGEEQE